MKIDVDRLAQVLNSTTKKIKEASEVVRSNPAAAINFIPSVTEQFRQLQTFGTINDITSSVTNESQKNALRSAIQAFLQGSKEAEEKVGALGAAIFGHPQFKDLTANLEQVKASLERGKRVEGTEEEQGI